MRREIIDRLLAEVPMLHACRISEENLPNGVWFTFEVRPLPPTEQLQMVIADIDDDSGMYLLKDGIVTHSRECNKQTHKLNADLLAAAKAIEPQTFRIAVWEGNDLVINGQPVAIALEPEISYEMYPDHPHISVGCLLEKYCIPDSICYTDNPKELGDEPYTRVLEAVQQVCIWLFKHQVWLASRKLGKGIWIGPDVIAKEEEQFYYLRNPYGKCYCGRNMLYSKCHLDLNFKNACNLETIFTHPACKFSRFKNNDGSLNLENYSHWWKNYNFTKRSTFNSLKRALSS
jgi:hypothetical protein